MQLMVCRNGGISCVYDETLNLSELGLLHIKRGSHVEPDDTGNWFADLEPVEGPSLGPFPNRSAALSAERTWLEQHWLSQVSQL